MSNYSWIYFVLPFVLAGAYWIFQGSLKTRWERGVFPENLRFNRDNLLEAYICLSARFIQADRVESSKKIQYMNSYFNQHFPQSNYDFTDSLRYSLSHPIQLSTVAAWLRLHLHQKPMRMQVLYFLAGMAMVDGTVNSREMDLLRKTNDLLGLSPADFESIIAMYRQQQERARQQEQERRQAPSKSRREREIELACTVLGVSENASLDEIKKAYRKLAKLHHPDRFATESAAQQKLANERFVEIQKAYEVIEKYRV